MRWMWLLALAASLAALGCGGDNGDGEDSDDDRESSRSAPAQVAHTVPPVVAAQLAAVDYDIKGMTCTGCAETIEETIKGVPGVQVVQLDFMNTRVHVEFDSAKTDKAKIASAVKELKVEGEEAYELVEMSTKKSS